MYKASSFAPRFLDHRDWFCQNVSNHFFVRVTATRREQQRSPVHVSLLTAFNNIPNSERLMI